MLALVAILPIYALANGNLRAPGPDRDPQPHPVPSDIVKCESNADCQDGTLCYSAVKDHFFQDTENCNHYFRSCFCRHPKQGKISCETNEDCYPYGLKCYEVIKDYYFNDFDSCNHYQGGCHCRHPRSDREGLPPRPKPDQCATGTPGNYRPRQNTSNCAKSPDRQDKTFDVDDSMAADPRRPIFHENQPGWYNLKIRCHESNSNMHDIFNIDHWFEGKPFDSLEMKRLDSWGPDHARHDEDKEFGYEPINTPSREELQRLGKQQQCMVAQEDKCRDKRIAACDAQHQAIDEAGGHIELLHRLSEYMECENRHQSWRPCESEGPEDTYSRYGFWHRKHIDTLHLHDLMPNGLNIVPQGGGAARPTTNETEMCIDFAVEQMCLSAKPCKDCKCSHGKGCPVEEFCREYREHAKPRLIHQEGGTGVPHTNSKGEFVAEECVDPNATWIVLLWDTESHIAPARGTTTVFGCPSKGFEGCGSKCDHDIPFRSWKGWLTSSPIYKSQPLQSENQYPFCTLWHQQERLAGLFSRDNDEPRIDDPTGYHAQGYLQPQVCYRKDNMTPFDKCDNLSPDNCHFKEGTKFDPTYGQFYHDWNWNKKWWWPRWGDALDWRKMLPVCFGCDHEQCAGGQSDEGQGTCNAIYDYKEPAGNKYYSPAWFRSYNKRSPLQRMTNTPGRSIIRDQGSCGSCWAFASMSTASHLTCIADCKENGRCLYDNIMSGSNFLDPFQLSAQSILSCNKQGAGCYGGWMKYGDEVYQNFGVMKEKNFPCKQAAAKDSIDGSWTDNANLVSSCENNYEYACKTGRCEPTVNVLDGSTNCSGGNPTIPMKWSAPHHEQICQNQWGAKCPYSWDYWQYPASSGWAHETGVYNLKRVHVSGWYNVASGADWESQYKDHLYNVGPFSVAFDVYTDFPWNGCSTVDNDHVYTVGPNANKRGGHGVSLIGYGWAYNICSGCAANQGCVSGWMKYWLLQNSWGRNWGQDGYWRHRRGTNEARIESWAATAPGVDVNCEGEACYGGKINKPRNGYKKNAKQSESDKFVELMEQVKERPEPSAACQSADWDPKHQDKVGTFDIAHSIQDVYEDRV